MSSVIDIKQELDDYLNQNYYDSLSKLAEKDLIFGAIWTINYNNDIKNLLEAIETETQLPYHQERESPKHETKKSIDNKGKLRIASIYVNGFRGRSFINLNTGEKEFVMNPNDNTVFNIRNDTGKTTTTQLLKWCFEYPQSQAYDFERNRVNFNHMDKVGARLLDFRSQDNPQTASIEITFTGYNNLNEKHTYKFTREVTGHVMGGDDEDGEDAVDIDIKGNIKDSLEIDGSSEGIKLGDEASTYLTAEGFSLQAHASFCFYDAEEAKKMASLAPQAISATQNTLAKKLHYRYLQAIYHTLARIEHSILDQTDAKKTVSEDVTKIRSKINKLNDKQKEFNIQLSYYKKKITELNQLIKAATEKVEELRKQSMDEKLFDAVKDARYDQTMTDMVTTIIETRNTIARESINWRILDPDIFEDIKKHLNEVKRLPEKVKKELVQECRDADACQVCGRDLDDASRDFLNKLQSSLAEGQVYDFLIDRNYDSTNNYDISSHTTKINLAISEWQTAKTKRSELASTMSKDNREEIEELEVNINNWHNEKGGINSHVDNYTEWMKDIGKKIQIEKDKLDGLEKWEPLSEHIFKIRKDLTTIRNDIMTGALKKVSEILDTSAKEIFGPTYNARWSNTKGLQIGHYNNAGKIMYMDDMSGMAVRQILAYVFTEIINDTGFLLVDTPSGNIDKHWRTSLAKHLKHNNLQVIAFCQEEELSNFAEYLSDKDPKNVGADTK